MKVILDDIKVGVLGKCLSPLIILLTRVAPAFQQAGARTVLTVASHSHGGLAEVLLEKILGLFVGILEILGVLGVPQPEIGEVMNVLAEDVLAVLVILAGIQDVPVPKFINEDTGHDRGVGVKEDKLQKPLVPKFAEIGLLLCPTFAFLLHRKTKLHLDHFQVKVVNLP